MGRTLDTFFLLAVNSCLPALCQLCSLLLRDSHYCLLTLCTLLSINSGLSLLSLCNLFPRLMDEYDIPKEAIASVEESGIVFIDEIDKLVSSGDYRGADASSEGVQRDLLPLIEGSTISTKHGNVNTGASRQRQRQGRIAPPQSRFLTILSIVLYF